MQNRRKSEVVEPLDPIALTLAMWLGLVVCVTGLIHLSEQAAPRPFPVMAGSMEDGAAFNPPFGTYGS